MVFGVLPVPVTVDRRLRDDESQMGCAGPWFRFEFRRVSIDDRYRSIVLVNKHPDVLTQICGTHVERCELNPIVFQIFYWETEVWVERFRHCFRIYTSGMKLEGEDESVLNVKRAEALRIPLPAAYLNDSRARRESAGKRRSELFPPWTEIPCICSVFVGIFFVPAR